MDERIGHWAFVVGVLLAVVAGLVPALQTQTVGWILVILGLVVGLLNITAKETSEFLIGVVALIVIGAASFGMLESNTLIQIVEKMLDNVVVLAVPAGLVVALKSLYAMAAH